MDVSIYKKNSQFIEKHAVTVQMKITSKTCVEVAQNKQTPD